MMKEKKNILILCEGKEEKPYIDKLLSFNRFNKELYCFCETINVKGNGSIIGRYQDKYNSNHYDLILVFCDADKGSSQYLKIIDDFNKLIFGGKDIASKVFIFANPVTMQIVLSHFGKVKLTSTGKKQNASIINNLTSIENYDAKEEQITNLINKIKYSSYDTMKNNLKDIATDINTIPSTNFLYFIEKFEGDDSSWIDEINKLINE